MAGGRSPGLGSTRGEKPFQRHSRLRKAIWRWLRLSHHSNAGRTSVGYQGAVEDFRRGAGSIIDKIAAVQTDIWRDRGLKEHRVFLMAVPDRNWGGEGRTQGLMMEGLPETLDPPEFIRDVLVYRRVHELLFGADGLACRAMDRLAFSINAAIS